MIPQSNVHPSYIRSGLHSGLKFGRMPTAREMRGYTDAMNQAYYDVFRKEDVSLAIHGQSLPDAAKGIYGSPYSESARAMMRFLKKNGINTLQLGPGGPNESLILPSPYETSSLLLNPLFFPFENLLKRRWANLLDNETLQNAIKGYPGRGTGRRNYEHHFKTTRRLMNDAFRNYKLQLTLNPFEPMRYLRTKKLQGEFERYKEENKEILDKAALYDALCAEYKMDYWPLWGSCHEDYGEFIKWLAPDHLEVSANFPFMEQLLSTHENAAGNLALMAAVHGVNARACRGMFKPVYDFLMGETDTTRGQKLPRWQVLLEECTGALHEIQERLDGLGKALPQNPEAFKKILHDKEHPDQKLVRFIQEYAKLHEMGLPGAVREISDKTGYLRHAIYQVSQQCKKDKIGDFLAQVDFDKTLYAKQATDAERKKVDSRIGGLREKQAQDIERFKFSQFLVEKAHRETLAEADKLGMRIMGDLPISYAPIEVWMYPDAFSQDFRLGAPPGRSVPDHGQSWGFYFMKNPVNPDGSLTEAGTVLKAKLERLKNLYPGGLRVDHGNGYIDPWTYHVGELADPFPQPHMTAFRLHSSPHLLDFLKLFDPKEAAKFWSTEGRPALLGLDRSDTTDAEAKEFKERLTKALGFSQEDNPKTIARKLEERLNGIFLVTHQEIQPFAEELSKNTYITTHQLNREALKEYRNAILETIETKSLQPFQAFMQQENFYKRNPLHVGWENAIESSAPEHDKKYGQILKMLTDTLEKDSETGTGKRPQLFIEDLGNVTLPISKVMNELNLTGTSTLIRYDANNPLGKKDRFYPANHPDRNMVMIGTHDHLYLSIWAEQKVFSKPKYHQLLAEHFTDFFLPKGTAEEKAKLQARLFNDRRAFINALYSCLWLSPAKYVQIFWPEFYGEEKMENIYNRPGTLKGNWEVSLPDGKSRHWFWRYPVHDFEKAYWAQFSDKSKHGGSKDIGRGMNPPEVLLTALQTSGKSCDPNLTRQLERYAAILKEPEPSSLSIGKRIKDIWENAPWWRS